MEFHPIGCRPARSPSDDAPPHRSRLLRRRLPAGVPDRPGIARAIGVPLIFAGILLGVASIATPAFLEGDRQQ